MDRQTDGVQNLKPKVPFHHLSTWFVGELKYTEFFICNESVSTERFTRNKLARERDAQQAC